MTLPARYEACWVPGLHQDIDDDESLEIGFGWLEEAERQRHAAGVIVM